MKYHREADGRLVLSLARGDALRSNVETLCAAHGVQGARVSAIGALEDPEIGWWDLDNLKYHKQVFPGIWELLSLDGNVTMVDGKPYLHVHTAISGHDYAVKGGHLFDSKVGVVVEMFIEPVPTPLPRAFCDAIGLNRWEPGG